MREDCYVCGGPVVDTFGGFRKCILCQKDYSHTKQKPKTIEKDGQLKDHKNDTQNK